MELKPGQKVRLVSISSIEDTGRYPGIVPMMSKYLNTIVTIQSCRATLDGISIFNIKEDNNEFVWAERWIESYSNLPKHLFEIEE